MLLAALTGGIATGKSYVLARVAERGVPTLDADAVVHGLLRAGQPTTNAIAARFGERLLRDDGSVDRASLGRLVFADAQARADLEAIVHPRVYERILRWSASERDGGARWVLADVPLLFETGHSGDFGLVIATTCSRALQLTRLQARGLGIDEASARLDAQWAAEEKARRADYVIRTDGTFDDTNRQLDRIIAAIEARTRTPG